MVPAYARVLLGRKPYSAPNGTVIEPVELEARKVVLSAAHIQRYREVCAVPASAKGLPPAYLHVLAMPLHMQLFVVKNFPVKVLGLIHLRNTIRVLAPVDERAPLKLRVYFDTMRLTDYGQEYDFTTSYEQNGTVVWEEISTMFARGNSGPKEGSKRPVIERSNHPEGVATDSLERRGQHRLALRARLWRFQSDPPDRPHRADVRLQAGGGAWHVVHGTLPGVGRASDPEHEDPDRHAVQAAGIHSLAGIGPDLGGGGRRGYFDVHHEGRPAAPGHAGPDAVEEFRWTCWKAFSRGRRR